MKIRLIVYLGSCLLAVLLNGCKSDETAADKPAPPATVEEATNRIDIPQSVRDNLQISFVRAERRMISKTLRVPGSFEHKAERASQAIAPVEGRVELHVQLYDQVSEGQLLLSLDAPEWRRVQQELADSQAAGGVAEKRLTAGQSRIDAARNEIETVGARIAQLEKLNAAGGGRASELAEARSQLAGAQTELAQAQEGLALSQMETLQLKGTDAQRNARFRQALKLAATWSGLREGELLQTTTTQSGDLSLWRALETVQIRAQHPGRVEALFRLSGSWAMAGQSILSLADHQALVFRAKALQSDIGLLSDGLEASITPPQGGSLQLQDTMRARMHVGVEADPVRRTFDLLLYPDTLAPWARPGVAAFAEIIVDQTGREEVAIPISCVVSDGLEKVYFMRDRKNPDRAVRVVGDLGANDGRWIAVNSGLKAGDEIVLHGAYELKLTSAGRGQGGGHFHSDGTFHEGDQ